MSFKNYWYVVAQSQDIKDKPYRAMLLDEWLVLFRNEDNQITALRDRCLHRSVRLSEGRIENGQLRCMYHGWLYDKAGQVVQIPSEGDAAPKGPCRKAPKFHVREVDGLVFVCLSEEPAIAEPFRSPHYGEKGWATVRLVNRFQNNVTNCVENFVDVPHTTFVHPKIFRDPEGHMVILEMERKDGSVRVVYKDEKHKLGLFSWFLNPKNETYGHIDSFHQPNVTSVEYHFSSSKHFYITSQSVPVTETETLVYTDLTYSFGVFTPFARLFVKKLGQAVIDQDLVILKNQNETIQKYPDAFQNSGVDLMHVWIESIRDAIEAGRDPRALPEKTHSLVIRI
ncbi:MAG: aromatic ring-hydroxylating dioxygenase subunit alpha [Proteobacteria bacterium]|nr:MAG: aromatic ring-hydroxylating dioxygenase subunit alpha [Pseudomonadota bacterium]